MMRVPRRCLAALVMVATVATACASTPQARPPVAIPATLEGTVYPCAGAPSITAARYAGLAVHITVHRGPEVIAGTSGHGAMAYQFSVPAGTYVLSGQLDTPSQTVHVRPGETLRTDLIADCS